MNDTLFYLASKTLGLICRAETWLVLGLLAVMMPALRGRARTAARRCAILLALVLLIGLFPLGDLLLRPLEARYPAQPPLERIAGIVVLGGGEDLSAAWTWGAPQLNAAADRVTAAATLARQNPGARLILTGGFGAPQDLGRSAPRRLSGAEIMQAFFTQQGIAAERLILEDRARNTAENARFSRALLPEGTGGGQWVLVTSAFHMPRAMRSFERAGWKNMRAWPADFRSAAGADRLSWNMGARLQLLNLALKEYAGLLVYGLTGR